MKYEIYMIVSPPYEYMEQEPAHAYIHSKDCIKDALEKLKKLRCTISAYTNKDSAVPIYFMLEETDKINLPNNKQYLNECMKLDFHTYMKENNLTPPLRILPPL